MVWPLSLLSELTWCSQGWKLGDMMFVTKRGLSDACNVVGKQIDQVSDSVNVSFFVHLLPWRPLPFIQKELVLW
jgi:hypothetical protein